MSAHCEEAIDFFFFSEASDDVIIGLHYNEVIRRSIGWISTSLVLDYVGQKEGERGRGRERERECVCVCAHGVYFKNVSNATWTIEKRNRSFDEEDF